MPQMFQGFYSSKLSPGRSHELAVDLTAPRDPHVHFRTFENSIFIQNGH